MGLYPMEGDARGRSEAALRCLCCDQVPAVSGQAAVRIIGSRLAIGSEYCSVAADSVERNEIALNSMNGNQCTMSREIGSMKSTRTSIGLCSSHAGR